MTGRKELQPPRILAGLYAKTGHFGEAASTARAALELARAAGDVNSARKIQQVLTHYEKLQAEKPDTHAGKAEVQPDKRQ